MQNISWCLHSYNYNNYEIVNIIIIPYDFDQKY